MESTGDIYKETIDYIKQIEKEIVFTLDDSQFEFDACITSKDINSYCDILLERISKELYITSSLEKDDLNSDQFDLNQTISNNNNSNNNNNNNNTDVHSKHISCTYSVDKNKFSSIQNLSSNNIDKLANYRYSIYDNSNKIFIYIASSSMIDQIVCHFI